MAKTAREEGFDEIADWFETLAKAEKATSVQKRSTPRRLNPPVRGPARGRASAWRPHGRPIFQIICATWGRAHAALSASAQSCLIAVNAVRNHA